MKHKIDFSLIAIFILILLSSCRKEKVIEVEVEKEYSWELYDRFLYTNKIQLNSVATDDKLYLMGRSLFSTITESANDSTILDVERLTISTTNSLIKRPTLVEDVFVGVSDNTLKFYPTNNPSDEGARIKLSMLEIDSSFAQFNFPFYWQGESIVFNDRNQCLVPYLRYDTIISPTGLPVLLYDETEFLFVQLSIMDWSVDTVYTSIVQKDFDFGILTALNSFNEYFFVTNGRRVLRISPELEIETVFIGSPLNGGGGLLKMFEYKEALYGLTTSEMYQSVDDGLSWQLIGGVDQVLRQFHFEVINDKLVGYYNGQLFHLTITDNQLTGIDELDNYGLSGNQITSISLFKGKVYITTLSGVFTRNLDSFFSYK